jgi:DnaJ-class molecular chaperone
MVEFMHIIKWSAKRKVKSNPKRYELCSVCKGTGRAQVIDNRFGGEDFHWDTCVFCRGYGYNEIQNWDSYGLTKEELNKRVLAETERNYGPGGIFHS